MTRKPAGRVISPDFLTSWQMAALSPDARFLAVAVMVSADSQGRLVALPKALCLDVTPDAIEAALAEMEAVGLIVRYTAEALPLLQVADWWAWQRLRIKKPSALPAPAGWRDGVTPWAPRPRWGYPKVVNGETGEVRCPVCKLESPPRPWPPRGKPIAWVCGGCGVEFVGTKRATWRPRLSRSHKRWGTLPSRVMVALKGDPLTAVELAARLGVTRRTIAAHLAALQRAGVVIRERGHRPPRYSVKKQTQRGSYMGLPNTLAGPKAPRN